MSSRQATQTLRKKAIDLQRSIKHSAQWQDCVEYEQSKGNLAGHWFEDSTPDDRLIANMSKLQNIVRGDNVVEQSAENDLKMLSKWVEDVNFWKVKELAKQSDCVKLVNFTMSRGVDVFSKDDSFLHHIVYRGTVEVLKQLVENMDVDVNGESTYGHSAFHIAVELCVEKTKLFLKRPDLQINRLDKHGRHALYLARDECLDILLVDSRTEVNSFFQLKSMLSVSLYRHRKPDLFRKLLRHPNIDVNKANYFGQPPFWQPLLWNMFTSPERLQDFFNDQRVVLAYRDNGRSALDLGLNDRWVGIVHRAERQRLQWARNKVRIMQSWSLPPHGQVLDEAMLTTHLLPFVADVIRPIEEIDDDNAQ